jgi:CRISPR-associated protein Csb2
MQASGFNARSFAETYVPANDKLSGVPQKTRQPRSFPNARPDSPYVYLRWEKEVPRELRGALEQVCAKVTRIGHSRSLAQMWVLDDAETVNPNWVPATGSPDAHFRVAEPGTLAYLGTQFNADAILRYHDLSEALAAAHGKEKTRLKGAMEDEFPGGAPQRSRPKLTSWHPYRAVSQADERETIVEGLFDPDVMIFRAVEEHTVLGLPATLQLTSALRNAVMKGIDTAPPEWVSGHEPDGAPSSKPHMAFFPLAFVGSEYADGHVMGMAIAIPRSIEPRGETAEESKRRVLSPLLFREDGTEKQIELWREKAWRWHGEREQRESPPWNLRPSTWTGPSKNWGTVTPIVLHHFPKKNREGDVERIVAEAFVSAGYPEPSELRVQAVSAFQGAPTAQQMPTLPDKGDGLCGYQVHVEARFPSRVRGPVLAGRGRYRGYGLMRPLEERKSDA